MGRTSMPAVLSQSHAPKIMAKNKDTRMSPWQMPNISCSHAHPSPSRNSPSLKAVKRGRSGRRNPYHIPAPAPYTSAVSSR